MTATDEKATLRHYLQQARDAMLWKLDGLSEYDVRRPLTPTGTNLLGLIKHLATIEAGYFGLVFNRPCPEPMPWLTENVEPNADLWATAEESRDYILETYRKACAHADATIAALDPDTTGYVSWWRPESNRPTLHRVLVHVIAETNRHAGHADIVRELIDGTTGLRPDNSNLPPVDREWWREYRDRLERVARAMNDA